MCAHDKGVCNVNGAADDCSSPIENACGKCKPEYAGDRCQFCKMGYNVINGKNGTIDDFGIGVECCKSP